MKKVKTKMKKPKTNTKMEAKTFVMLGSLDETNNERNEHEKTKVKKVETKMMKAKMKKPKDEYNDGMEARLSQYN